jgi:hypothetical protein
MFSDQLFVPSKVKELKATVLPDGRWLLYHQNQRSAFTLNAAAGILWELCDGQTPVDELIVHLKDFYPSTSPKRLAQETETMLTDFLERGLVVNNTAHTAS